MAQIALDLFYSLTNCIHCFPSSPQLKVNERSFKILRLLGEGGFSYVYLVQDTRTSELFALKKIRCPFGQESVAQALKEAEAYALFSPNEHIISAIDYAVQDARDRSDPGSKVVYILLPYYRRGNLQDAINANLVNHTRFPERRLLQLFLGIARGLKAMHHYRVRGGGGSNKGTGNTQPGNQREAAKIRQTASDADEDASRKAKGKSRASDHAQQADDFEASAPLMDDEVTASQAGVPTGELRAYAHRDIKPGNIMIADDGDTPVLMDLGSLAASPVAITSRSLAIAVQEQAAEHSTMPYRAPELFDVKTDTVVDTKADIWSVGCTLYACLVGKSPFEARSEETGGSLSMCVLGGDWRFPGEKQVRGKGKKVEGEREGDGISERVKEVVRRCLAVEPAERPDVDGLIALLTATLEEMPEDGGGGVGDL